MSVQQSMGNLRFENEREKKKQFKQINECVFFCWQTLLQVRLTAHFLHKGIAKEMRHSMRQGKCHACRLPLLIRLNIGHVAFDHVVMTD